MIETTCWVDQIFVFLLFLPVRRLKQHVGVDDPPFGADPILDQPGGVDPILLRLVVISVYVVVVLTAYFFVVSEPAHYF